MSKANTKVMLEGMYRHVNTPFRYWVNTATRKRNGELTIKVRDIPYYQRTGDAWEDPPDENGSVLIWHLFENKLQPLYRITEYRDENGRTWVSAKFAKNVSPEEWKKYPYYGQHTINEMC